MPFLQPALWTEIKAGNIDEAAERIIDFLDDMSRETTVIYFNGWYGVGASAILKVVAKQLKSSPEKLGLDKIIHVDCSLWQSKRVLQKAIAQELELPLSVMALFDQYDEEDDFDGVEEGARGLIPDVRTQMLEHLWTRRFLVIFHNGSGSYIDLWEYGVPVIGVSNKRVLWTSQGRFCPTAVGDAQEIAGMSDVAIYVLPGDHNVYSSEFLLHGEAEDVARYTGIPKPGMSPEIVKECIMYYYMLTQRGGNHSTDFGKHMANYWVCSGVIQSTATRSAWNIAQALHTNMILGSNYRWDVSALHVPFDSMDASFFCTVSRVSLEAKMFQHSSAHVLRVIHLYRCIFSFASPPFLVSKCLRFLLLDHCQDNQNNKENPVALTTTDRAIMGEFLRMLWVLELSYTEWYWLLSTEALDKMTELRELNVKGVKDWRLFLLECEELRAILWPTTYASVEVVHIDTTSTKHGQATAIAGSSASPANFKWYISPSDGRLLRSLKGRTYSLYNAHVEISSPAAVAAAAIGCELGTIHGIINKSRTTVISSGEQHWPTKTISQQQQPAANNKLYADVISNAHHLQLEATTDHDWTWPCQPRKDVSHYIRLQDEGIHTRSLPPLPDSICGRASSLHVHDSLSLTSIRGHSDPDKRSVNKNIDGQSNVPHFWYILEWCRVERCPKIEGAVFTPPATTYGIEDIFVNLKILWASHLPNARYIWNWGTHTRRKSWMRYDKSLLNLQYLHLDCCPRLIHVLTIRLQNLNFSWPRLETIEIVYCGDLKEVFPLEDDDFMGLEEQLEFSSLKHIHLHELPALQRICGNRRMLAPKLETVKIRGCWSLTCLPSLLGRSSSSSKPKVECEKEWWDGLQWDGVDVGHAPSLYEPNHSRYYKKKTLPRGSLLSEVLQRYKCP
uniref:Disease resistance protein At4g27190-like leucine-rich repeats domain-containing protein n=1 Tax=Leersia perrieri TaxID=77586 RepID=A0A0D9W1U9_9ORYZ